MNTETATEQELRDELKRLLNTDLGLDMVLRKGRPAAITSTMMTCPRETIYAQRARDGEPVENIRRLVTYLQQAEQYKKENPDQNYFSHLYPKSQ